MPISKALGLQWSKGCIKSEWHIRHTRARVQKIVLTVTTIQNNHKSATNHNILSKALVEQCVSPDLDKAGVDDANQSSVCLIRMWMLRHAMNFAGVRRHGITDNRRVTSDCGTAWHESNTRLAINVTNGERHAGSQLNTQCCPFLATLRGIGLREIIFASSSRSRGIKDPDQEKWPFVRRT